MSRLIQPSHRNLTSRGLSKLVTQGPPCLSLGRRLIQAVTTDTGHWVPGSVTSSPRLPHQGGEKRAHPGTKVPGGPWDTGARAPRRGSAQGQGRAAGRAHQAWVWICHPGGHVGNEVLVSAAGASPTTGHSANLCSTPLPFGSVLASLSTHPITCLTVFDF